MNGRMLYISKKRRLYPLPPVHVPSWTWLAFIWTEMGPRRLVGMLGCLWQTLQAACIRSLVRGTVVWLREWRDLDTQF